MNDGGHRIPLFMLFLGFATHRRRMVERREFPRLLRLLPEDRAERVDHIASLSSCVTSGPWDQAALVGSCRDRSAPTQVTMS